MDFNLEQFVEDYVQALRDNDSAALISLISNLPDTSVKADALAGVIAALEADPEVAATASSALDSLKAAQETISKIEANVGADIDVLAPSIKMSDPVVAAIDADMAEEGFEPVEVDEVAEEAMPVKEVYQEEYDKVEA